MNGYIIVQKEKKFHNLTNVVQKYGLSKYTTFTFFIATFISGGKAFIQGMIYLYLVFAKSFFLITKFSKLLSLSVDLGSELT